MAGWVPTGIGLEGMMSQIGAQPGQGSTSGISIGDTSHSQDFDQWLQGIPLGEAPWEWAPMLGWLRQNDPQMYYFASAMGALGGPSLWGLMAVWSHDARYRNVLQRYWEQNIKTKPKATTTTPTTAPTTPSQTTIPPGLTGTSPVPTPFPYSMYHNPDQRYGYNFGDQAPPHSYKSGWHEGQDYAVGDGTSLVSPFTGTVKYVGYDPAGYGNYVDIQFGNSGLYMRFSHLSFVNVRAGQKINAGDRFGFSGSTGYSTGPHLLIELRNAQNQPLDPRPLLNEIFNGSPTGAGNGGKGITMDAFGQTSATSTGGAETGAETTPDGHVLYAGTDDRAFYDMVNEAYKARFAKDAPYSMAMAMKAAGVTNTSQMAAVAANWPSDIPGVNFGQRDNIYNSANGIAMKNWGRPIPDSLVKRLATEGVVTQGEIALWFDTHVASDLPAGDYQQIYDAANPAIQHTYRDGPPPDYIDSLHRLIKTKGMVGRRAP